VRAIPGRTTRIPLALVETSDGVALRVYAPARSGITAPAATPGAAVGGDEGAVGVPGMGVLAALAALALAARRRRA
jgi:hypothetical protein